MEPRDKSQLNCAFDVERVVALNLTETYEEAVLPVG